MVIEADLHNFGRSVQKVGRASGTYYQKPRPVYWERLFFGVDSPLASFFGKGGAEFQPKHALFNLETEIDADFTGLSREVLSVPASVERNHFYSFGVLLAYCYVFGVRDLHRHNILRTATHLQVVDAEVVLVKLLLPNETLLLPFKDIGAELASVSLLQIEYPAGLTENTRRQILSGYLDTFECFERSSKQIRQFFSQSEGEIRAVPVRHIMRDTVHYRRWMDVVPSDPFFDAELAQLSRGDIPYFFKFIGNNRLYAYTDAEGAYQEVVAPVAFQKAIDRDASHPLALLEPERIGQLLPTGALFLAKRLFDPSWIGSFPRALPHSRVDRVVGLHRRSR